MPGNHTHFPGKPSESASGGKQHWSEWQQGLFTLAAIFFLALCFALPPFLSRQANLATIDACRRAQEPFQTIEGQLRIGGPDFYIVANKRWYLLRNVCAGKTRTQCLAANEGAGLFLEEHIGQPVSAHICPAGVVDYTVGGRKFSR
jgi:hypothetical protein